MSLLMDALRKAEEAKKKAELEGKSKPVVAEAAAAPADEVPDSEIEFEPAVSLSPAPGPAPAPGTESLLDDLAEYTAGKVARAAELERYPESVPQVAAQIRKDAEPVAAHDHYSIDFESSPPAAPTFDPGLVVAAEPATSARQQGSITQLIRAQQETGADAHSVDTSLEEQDRRSARSVSAAKRNASPLTKNLQFTALGVAAVLLVVIGTYLYINLRTGSGISMPVADQGFQQPQREFTEAELELTDADLAGATVADSLPITSPAPEFVAAPEIDASPAITDLNPEAVNNTAATVATSIPGNVTATDPVRPIVNPSAAPVASRTGPTPARSANPAASLQPQRIEPQLTEPQPTEPQPTEPQPTEPQPTEPQPTEPQLIQPQLIEPRRPEPASLVSFTRRAASPAGNPLIENAYSFYQSGNLEQAERLYREALAVEPLNRNALLGVAAIAAHRDDTVEALELYSRLLARDPSDPVARAGLLEIMPRGNLQQQETELLRLQRQHPDIAPLAYAVGNFLASQQRWSEAQQAYFSALQLAKNDAQTNPVNPDYAFNLAVSLEHLGQFRVAGSYYREALVLAEAHPAGFSLAMAQQRLISMESASNE